MAEKVKLIWYSPAYTLVHILFVVGIVLFIFMAVVMALRNYLFLSLGLGSAECSGIKAALNGNREDISGR